MKNDRNSDVFQQVVKNLCKIHSISVQKPRFEMIAPLGGKFNQ